jgi:hypothetical protein
MVTLLDITKDWSSRAVPLETLIPCSEKSIILDCAVYFGNSGGPVIQVEPYSPFQTHFAVIGVVSEYVPFADHGRRFQYLNKSGYAVAVPMNFVLELLKAGS